jgi:pimeloyl-ACP methyl ester carboxylesterase
VLLHGFPESWYSWRRQLVGLAEAGYHVVAPNQRGYAGTTCPPDVADFVQLHMVGDVVGLCDLLGADRPVVVGHDWGAVTAWTCALLRPDRFRGVASLSVPYFPRSDASMLGRLRAAYGDRAYMQYFQEPGVAEKDLEADVRSSLLGLLYSASGDAPTVPVPVIPDGGVLAAFAPPAELPAWLTEADLDVYADEFAQSGFTGPLNWYRAIEATYALMSPWHMAPVLVPALFVAGDRDLVMHFPGMPEMLPHMKQFVPHLTESLVLPGCGHWTQQERPAEVTEALTRFLAGLPV